VFEREKPVPTERSKTDRIKPRPFVRKRKLWVQCFALIEIERGEEMGEQLSTYYKRDEACKI
jgi:hypothetical protein